MPVAVRLSVASVAVGRVFRRILVERLTGFRVFSPSPGRIVAAGARVVIALTGAFHDGISLHFNIVFPFVVTTLWHCFTLCCHCTTLVYFLVLSLHYDIAFPCVVIGLLRWGNVFPCDVIALRLYVEVFFFL